MTRFRVGPGAIQAVLFDLDGTLVDSAPDLAAAVEAMRQTRGLAPMPLESYRHMAGAGARGMLGIGFGITPDNTQFDALRQEFFDSYERCLTVRTKPFAGVPHVIQALQTMGLSWGVVTNKATRFSAPLTQALELFNSAAVIISGDTTPHAKPHPEPLFEAARRIGLDPGACLYVGDDRRDVVAGKAAGMPTVAALYGYLGADAEPQSWGADAIIDSVDQLLDLLQQDA